MQQGHDLGKEQCSNQVNLSQFLFLSFLSSNKPDRRTNEPQQRRPRNGRVKVARPLGSGSSDGTAAGVAEIGNTKVWTFHAMNGAVVREEDAGDFVGKLTTGISVKAPTRKCFFSENF